MNTYELIAPCHFGLESVLKREIYDLGYDISSVEDGKVTFMGDSEAIRPKRLQSYLIKLKTLNGRILYLRMVNSGLLKLILLTVNCSAALISSQLLRKPL